MFRALLVAELKLARRSRRVRRVAVATLLLAGLAGLAGAARWRADLAQHAALSAYGAERFATQGPDHPHTIAHRGYVVARPPPPLGFLDGGASAAFGRWLKLDAHTTRDLRGAEIVALVRAPAAGRFDLGLLLAVVLPAFVLGLGYDRVARDDRRGAVAMLRAAGLRSGPYAAAKIVGLFARLGLAVLAPAVLVSGALTLALAPSAWPRLLGWWGVQGAGLAAWALLALAISAFAPSPRAALGVGLAAWATLALVVPPAASAAARAMAAPPPPATLAARFATWADSAHARTEARRAAAVRDIRRRHPDWDGAGPAPEVIDAVMLRLANEEVAEKMRRMLDAVAAEQRREGDLAAALSFTSPSGLAMLAGSAVAGSDLGAARAAARHFEAYRGRLMAWLDAWWAENGRGGFDDYRDRLGDLDAAPRPTPPRPGADLAWRGARRPAALLLALIVGLTLAASLGVRRRLSRPLDARAGGPRGGPPAGGRALGLYALERRRLLRSARGRAVAGLLFVGAVAASGLGAALTRAHRAAAEADVAAARDRLGARRADGLTPAEVALWTDTVIPRPVAPLAALAAGELDALPDAATVRLTEPPRPTPARAERSPASALLGTFDVAWLLALLLPLATLALGYDSVARDRSRGTLGMLLAFAPSPARLVRARIAAVAAVAAVGLLPGLAVGLVAVGVILASWPDPVDAGLALALAGAAILAWSAATVAASAHARTVGDALASGLGAWAFFAVVQPMALGALAPRLHPPPDPRAALEAERAVAERAAEDPEPWIARGAAADPGLDPERARDGVGSHLRAAVLAARGQRRDLAGANHAERRAARGRARVLELGAYLGPSTIVSSGLAGLGGVEPGARARFAWAAAAYQARLDAYVSAPLRERRTAPGPLEAPWPSLEDAPRTKRAPALIGSALLLGLAAFATRFARRRLERGRLDPTPEEA